MVDHNRRGAEGVGKAKHFPAQQGSPLNPNIIPLFHWNKTPSFPLKWNDWLKLSLLEMLKRSLNNQKDVMEVITTHQFEESSQILGFFWKFT